MTLLASMLILLHLHYIRYRPPKCPSEAHFLLGDSTPNRVSRSISVTKSVRHLYSRTTLRCPVGVIQLPDCGGASLNPTTFNGRSEIALEARCHAHARRRHVRRMTRRCTTWPRKRGPWHPARIPSLFSIPCSIFDIPPPTRFPLFLISPFSLLPSSRQEITLHARTVRVDGYGDRAGLGRVEDFGADALVGVFHGG